MNVLDRLRSVRRQARRLKAAVDRRPLDQIRWLPSQFLWLSSTHPVKLYRAGNQHLGKTTAGLGEVIYRCLGHHPFIHVPKRPIEAWIICASWKQSLAIQKKLWDLLPKDLIEPATRFHPVNGFHANEPTVMFLNGSIIRFRTTNQGVLDLSSATIDVALFDEPPRSPRVFGEILKRVSKAGDGVVLLTLTPVNAPTDWLKALTVPSNEAPNRPPMVADFHARLTAENMIPVGSSTPIRLKDGTPCGQAWVDDEILNTLPHEVPVICHGEWDMRLEGPLFKAYRDSGPASHVSAELPEDVMLELRFSTDHGSGSSFDEVALLVAVDHSAGGMHPHVYVIDEYVSDEESTSEEDAAGFLAMLLRNGIEWWELDKAYGDRLYQSITDRRTTKKTNQRIMAAITAILAERVGEEDPGWETLKPQIDTVKRGSGRGRGSVHEGCRYLHELMVRNRLSVSSRCTRLRQSLQRWEGRDDEWKHMIDTLRYCLDDLVFAESRRREGGRVYLYG